METEFDFLTEAYKLEICFLRKWDFRDYVC